MKKKFFILFVFLFVFSINIQAEGDQPPGSGTDVVPYQVSTLDHLLWISTNSTSWDKHFILTSNINASQSQFWDDSDDNSDGQLYNDPNDANGSGDNDGWFRIGTTSTGFTGDFDGNNFEISHLTSNRPTELYLGLFGYTKESNISNLGVVSVSLNGNKYMGAIAGNATRAIITNCYSSGTIQATSYYVGGLVGITWGANGPPDGLISNCYSTCSISSEGNYIGGLVGKNGSDNEIINSYASGSVVGEGDYIGGLVGENNDEALIYQCYATGSVTGESHIGGLVGYNNIECWVLNCYSTGDVHISDLVGSIEDAAGFCGRNYNSNIRFCYSTGDVINDHTSVSNPDDKGFLGVKAGVMSVYLDNNFFDNTSSNQSSDGANAATEKTTAAMVNLSTFTDETTSGLDNAWDFVGTENDDSGINDYWDINNGSGRPFLSWENKDMNWLGNNTNWNDLNNWSGSMELPTSSKDIIIPSTANNPVISSGVGADCHDLSVQGGASLIMNDGGSLITTGSITNIGSISIYKSIDEDTKWHLISAPNNNSTASIFAGYYLQQWDEETSSWQDISSAATPLTPVIGFSLFDTPAKTSFNFTGTPNTGNQTYSLTYHDSEGGSDGMNLIGNPYPSAIDLNVIDPDYGAFYVWNPTTDDYEEYNGGSGNIRYLAPTQGFFVYSSSDETFTIDNSARTHTGANTFYKSTNSKIENGIILSTNQQDKLYIKLMDEASEDFDFIYDAFKIISLGEGNSQIYSKYIDTKLAIDCRPETGIIQLGYQNEQNGHYTIEIIETDGISTAILEDTKTETFHNLQNGNYEFAWEITDVETRFILHLNATGFEDISTLSTQIFAYQKTIHIRSSEKLNNAQLYIVDMMGRTVYEQVLVDGQNESISIPLEDGIYLVQLVSDGGTQVEKVILK